MSINLNAEEPIQYEDCFIAYLDVLGFKKLVFSPKLEDHRKIEQYFGIVNSVINDLRNISAKQEICSIIISDSVILSMPVNKIKENQVSKLRHLCIAIGIIQQTLAKKNIWIRGAISIGKAYFDRTKNQIVGPAYINSFLLEEELAINPRVILDSKIIDELQFTTASDLISAINNTQHGSLHYYNWNSNILFDWNTEFDNPGNFINQDVPIFIDYLSKNVNMNDMDLLEIIKNIRKNIYQDIRIYSKYRWLVDYLKAIYLYDSDDESNAISMLRNL